MILTQLDGTQFPPNIDLVVRQRPYRTRTDTPGNLAIGVTAVQIVDISAITNPLGADYLLQLRNVSTSGQILGIDTTNAVTIANAGILLYPGETIQLPFMFTNLFGIASAASGELRRFTIRTS